MFKQLSDLFDKLAGVHEARERCIKHRDKELENISIWRDCQAKCTPGGFDEALYKRLEVGAIKSVAYWNKLANEK